MEDPMETWLKATILDSLPLDKHYDTKFCMYDSDDEEEIFKRIKERKMEQKKMEQKKNIAAKKAAEIKEDRGMGGFSELVGAKTTSDTSNIERGRQLSQRLRNSGASDIMQKCNLTGAPRGSSSLLNSRKKRKDAEAAEQSAKIAMASAKQQERARNPVITERGANGEVVMFDRDWEPAGLKNGGSSVSMDDFINDPSKRSGLLLTRRSDRPIASLATNGCVPPPSGGGGLKARRERFQQQQQRRPPVTPWFQGEYQWPSAMQEQPVNNNAPVSQEDKDGGGEDNDNDVGDTPIITYGVMLQPNQEIDGMAPNQELLQAVQESMDSQKPKLRTLNKKQMEKELRERDVEESDKELECVVCMGDFEMGEKKITLGCSHVFHAECIRSWLSKHAICPQCRYEVGKDGERSMGSSLLKQKKKEHEK